MANHDRLEQLSEEVRQLLADIKTVQDKLIHIDQALFEIRQRLDRDLPC